jgi:copper resistance protein B
MIAMAPRRIVLAVCILMAAAGRGVAQQPQTAPPAAVHAPDTLPTPAEQAGWPEPVTDRELFRYLLFDNAEFQRAGGAPDAFRWDTFGWRGGDVHRFWFKSEGRVATQNSEGSEFEAQALYGKLIWPFFDLQAGVRFDQRIRPGSDPSRVYAVLGLQGLSPYRFDVEPTLFVSHKGQVSGRLTATYDALLSQRLILQPRFETNVAVQRDEEIGVGAGWNDAEFGVRLRYEVRREFAPYVGATWKESFGATHQLTTQVGGDPSHFVVVAGLRAWF